AVLCAALLRTAPQALQVVELARGRLHGMHYHIAQIEQHPLAGFHAFTADRAHTLLLDLLKDIVGQRLDVTAGRTTGNHHEVADPGLPTHIDNGTVLGLHIFQCGDCQLDQLFVLNSETLHLRFSSTQGTAHARVCMPVPHRAPANGSICRWPAAHAIAWRRLPAAFAR